MAQPTSHISAYAAYRQRGRLATEYIVSSVCVCVCVRVDSLYTYLEVVVARVVTINQVFALYRLVVVKLSFREPVADESEDVGHGDLKTESNVFSNNCKLPCQSMAVLI